MHSTLRTLLLLVLTSFLCALPTLAERPVDQTYPANANAAVSVENISGSITVKGWNRDEVQVTGTLGDDVEELSVDASGDRIHIEVDLPEGRNRRLNDASADLTIHMPSGGSLSVETVSASIEASELDGALELESVSGNITVSADAASIQISAVSGDATVTGASPSVEVELVSGKASIEGAEEELSVQSVSGVVEVTASNLRRGELSTVSGRLVFTGDLAANGQLEVENHSGMIELNLPGSIGADIEVETFSGDILNDLSSDEPERTDRYTPGKELHFSLNGGGAQIEVSSFSGTVKLQQR